MALHGTAAGGWAKALAFRQTVQRLNAANASPKSAYGPDRVMNPDGPFPPAPQNGRIPCSDLDSRSRAEGAGQGNAGVGLEGGLGAFRLFLPGRRYPKEAAGSPLKRASGAPLA
jgi:hypothetical protein